MQNAAKFEHRTISHYTNRIENGSGSSCLDCLRFFHIVIHTPKLRAATTNGPFFSLVLLQHKRATFLLLLFKDSVCLIRNANQLNPHYISIYVGSIQCTRQPTMNAELSLSTSLIISGLHHFDDFFTQNIFYRNPIFTCCS